MNSTINWNVSPFIFEGAYFLMLYDNYYMSFIVSAIVCCYTDCDIVLFFINWFNIQG